MAGVATIPASSLPPTPVRMTVRVTGVGALRARWRIGSLVLRAALGLAAFGCWVARCHAHIALDVGEGG